MKLYADIFTFNIFDYRIENTLPEPSFGRVHRLTHMQDVVFWQQEPGGIWCCGLDVDYARAVDGHLYKSKAFLANGRAPHRHWKQSILGYLRWRGVIS